MSETNESVADQSIDLETPKPTCESAFQSFVMNEQESTMLYFGNGLMDHIFKFKNIHESDVEELKSLLNQFCNDKAFNEFVSKQFDPNNSAFDFKSFIQDSAPNSFPLISEISGFNILNDIFSATENVTIQKYLLFLTLSPVDLYEMTDEKFKPLGINYTAFQHFFYSFVDKFINERTSCKRLHRCKSCITLLSFICQNDGAQSLIPTRVKYLNVQIDYSRCKSFDDVWKQILINYRLLNHRYKVKGFNFDGSFSCAVKLFSYLAPVWDQMSASSSLRDKPLPQMSRSFGLSGGARYNDSDVVRIFAGNYGLVRSSEPSTGPVAIDLVSDFQSFNQLSNSRKLQVSNFLLSNRKRFNTILENATKVVINNFQHNLNPGVVTQSLKSQQFAPQYARNVGFNVENGMLNDTVTFISRLQKSYAQKNPTSFSDAISFIVHDYIPMLDQFSNRCDSKYGVSESKSIMGRFATDNVLDIVGVGSQIDFNSMRNRGGSTTYSPPITYPSHIQNQPSLEGGRSTSRKVKSYEDNEDTDYENVDELEIVNEMNSPIRRVEGGSSGKDLINAFIEGQKKFNKAYEDIYHQLTRELNNVNLTDIHKQTYTKLYTICGQFESIAIKNPNTTTYLSGYYGAKDYNLLYTRAVESTINSINAAGVSAFSGVVKVLDSLKQLLVHTRKEMIQLRNKYISAPKSVSELFIVAVRDIKQPCKLTNSDFIALSDAVSRLYNTIKNTASETSSRNTKSQLEAYMQKVQDRSKIIEEHYAQRINGLKIAYSKFSDRENGYGRDLQISFEEQKRDALIYINSVVDTQLTKDRIDNLKKLTLSQDQINTIERAYTSFKNIQITPEFNKEMKKIAKLLDPKLNTLGNIYKLISKLKKLVISGQYFNFLAQLYKELKLISDFDWNKFADQLANLMVISSVTVEPVYSVGNERKGINRWMHETCMTFEEECQKMNDEYPVNSGYLFMREYLGQCKRGLTSLKLFDANNGTVEVFHGDNTTVVTNGNDFISIDLSSIKRVTVGGVELTSFPEILKKFEKYTTKDIDFDGNNAKDNVNDVDMWNGIKKIINKNGKDVTFGNLMYFFKICKDICDKYYTEPSPSTRGQLKTIVPYYAKHLLVYLNYFIRALNNLTLSFNTQTRSSMHEYSIIIHPQNTNNAELGLIRYAFDAFNTNILSVIDKYWGVRYRGSLDLPLNLSTVLRGGDGKQDGGTIFDSTILHDQSYSSVIVDAVPFYICACNICEYYMKTFCREPENNVNDFKLYLNINKISTLYPVYEIFIKYNATTKSLTPTQLKTLLAVFNNFWDQTNGNESSRLSRSIDLLFNELNACLIFSNKLQIDIFKNTGKFDDKTINVLDLQLNKLINNMKEVISASIIDSTASPEDQAKYFEALMGEAYKRIKNDPEPQRLSTLKAILSDDRGTEDKFKDYYKFMELVITPMLTTATCYSNIFMLFDTYSFQGDEEQHTFGIDFNKVCVTYPDFVNPNSSATDENAAKYMKASSAWELITRIKKGDYYLKSVLVDHPIVLTYNRTLLRQALDNLHTNGKFILPKFWIVMDEHTYPASSSISFKTLKKDETITKSDYQILLKQLYPTVNGKTVADYYNHAVSEFYSDFDHYIHNYIAYPGISDKTIRVITESLHDSIKVEKFEEETGVYGIKGMPDELTNNLNYKDTVNKLKDIKIQKSSSYIYPPAPYEKFVLPQLNDPACPLSGLSLSVDSKGGVRIDGTSVYIKTKESNKIGVCNYDWFDWVIFNLAKCDKSNYCIPYKLLQMFKNNNELSESSRGAIVLRKGETQYTQNTDGSYNSLITQNIIARSESSINNEKVDYSSLNSSWIAGLISITPYIINALESVKSSIHQHVEYKRTNVYRELCVLTEILTLFYDEIGNYAPFMGFMTDTIQLSSTKPKPHLFAELLSFVEKNSVDIMDISNFIKIEWANMWFFNNLDGISFPTFKNRDKFEWIKSYASDKIENGVFGNEFNTTIQTLGRNVWSAVIAKSIEYNSQFKNINRELDELILKSINILSECDTGIIQQFIDNVVNFYNRTSKGEVLSITGKGITGGNDFNHIAYTNGEGAIGHLDEILSGIGYITESSSTINKLPISDDNDYFTPEDNQIRYQLYPGDAYESTTYKTLVSMKGARSVEVIQRDKVKIQPKDLSYFRKTNNYNVIRRKLEDFDLSRMIHGSNEIYNKITGNTANTKFWMDLTDSIRKAQNDAINKYNRQYYSDGFKPNTFGYVNSNDITMNNEGVLIKADNYRILSDVTSTAGQSVSGFLNKVPYIKELMSVVIDGCRISTFYAAALKSIKGQIAKILEDEMNSVVKRSFESEYDSQTTDIKNGADLATVIDAFLKKVSKYNAVDKTTAILTEINNIIDTVAKSIKCAERLLSSPLCMGVRRGIDILNYTKLNDTSAVDISTADEKLLHTITAIKAMALANGINRNKLPECKDMIAWLNIGIVLIYSGNDENTLKGVFNTVFEFNNTLTATGEVGGERDLATLFKIISWNFDKTIITIDGKTADNMKYIRKFGDATAATPDNFVTSVIAGIANTITSSKHDTLNDIMNGKIVNCNAADADANEANYKDDVKKIKGGDINDYKDILDIAKILATSIFARAIYVDQSIKGDSIYPILKYDGSMPDTSIYLYKYLYNPNLATLFNKTSLTNINFVQLAIGKKNKFIVDPKYSIQFIYEINPTKNLSSLRILKPFESSTTTDTKVSDLYKSSTTTYMKKYNALINNEVTKVTTVRINGVDENISAAVESFIKFSIADIPNQIDIPNKDLELILKPLVKNIVFDERMVQNVPHSRIMEQWIFSPQKDIYNATTLGLNTNEFYAPSFMLEMDDITSSTDVSSIKLIRYSSLIDAFSTNNSFASAKTGLDLKQLSQFANARMNPIHLFINNLLNDNINKFMDVSKIGQNLGFDIGSLGLSGHGLFGGAVSSNLTFNHTFMNPSSEFADSNPRKLLASVYNYPDNDTEVYENGKLIYEKVLNTFRGGMSSAKNYEVMFAYIMNYFHKYNISFDAIYNQVCFPSIIYGASALNAYIPKLVKVVNNMNLAVDSANPSFKGGLFAYIYKYLSGFISNDRSGKPCCSSLDYAANANWQIMFTKVPRDPDMPFFKVITNMDKETPDADKNYALWLANQFSSPSIGNNFFSEIVNYITYIPDGSLVQPDAKSKIKKKDYANNQDRTYNHCQHLYQLFPSGIMDCIRHFDVMSTFIYTMFMLLKQTSFYDHEMNKDASYFKVPNPEPLSIV